MSIDKNIIPDLEKISDPQALITEIFKRFGNRAAIGTSGQLTGSVMIDMASHGKARPRIFTIDTLRLFPETYTLFGEIEKKYGFKIERLKPDPKKIEKMVKDHGEFLFFDSKEKQEYCCQLRKVEPNERVLETLDVWLTGLRTDQSESRAGTKKFQIIEHGPKKRPILKVAPLVDWTEKQLRDYIAKNKVPLHPLLKENKNGWFYESLGCVICTTPIGPGEPRRAGRWRWFNVKGDDHKECGLHVFKEDNV
ncbi:MAG TPA: phosphoadenylyl-sulfate reductase [Deltaproteobacteria bacterium]|nr:phosphoadenylyl-sulfate reductase [Deltaproteobacteria bacterium]